MKRALAILALAPVTVDVAAVARLEAGKVGCVWVRTSLVFGGASARSQPVGPR